MPPELFSRRLFKLLKAPASWVLAGSVLLELALRHWAGAAGLALLGLAALASRSLLASQARRALDELRPLFQGTARACRDGIWQPVPASQLDPGDQIHLQAGDQVPADVLLLDGQLLVEPRRAAGPSQAAAGSPVLAGGMVLHGSATARVILTGAKIRLGQPWSDLPDVQPGALQSAARQFDALLLLAGGLLGGLALAAASAAGLPLETGLALALLLLCAAALAGSGSLLPAALAQGARELWKGGGLVSRLRAIEDLAGMQVLVLEKAGLLTEDSLAIARIQPFAPYAESDVLTLAAMACDETASNLEDRVILARAQANGRAARKQRLAFTPYDPARRLSEAIYEEDGQPLRVLKGAPAAILGLLKGSQADLYTPIHALAARGWRVSVVAVGAGAALQVAGLLAFQDPLRNDARALIQRLKGLGLKVVMATSDSRATAQALAVQAGLEGLVYPGDVLDRQPGEQIMSCDVIAELSAEQKVGLAQAYRRAGVQAGLTGKTLADAPALRAAQVGVAVLPAVDAARGAAGLALARPHLSRLVDSITASREILWGLLAAVLVPAARLVLLALFLLVGLAFSQALLVPPLAIAAWLVLNQLETLALARERGAGAGRWQAPALGAAALARALPALVVSLVVCGAARAWGGLPPAGLRTLATLQLFLAGQAILYQGRIRGPRPGRVLLAFSALQLLAVTALAALGLFLAPLPIPWLLGVLVVNAVVFVGLELVYGRGMKPSPSQPIQNPLPPPF